MKIFLIILGLNLILFTLLFIYCACKISSRADKIIEKMNQEKQKI